MRTLLSIRLFIGRLLGWDREPTTTAWESFATRLTTADRARSLAAAGTREGLFRVVYRLENERLLEVINRTAHATALSALVETANTYHFYFGVYVRNLSRFTPVYMALIAPFRKQRASKVAANIWFPICNCCESTCGVAGERGSILICSGSLCTCPSTVRRIW